jgi:hypothetical protein
VCRKALNCTIFTHERHYTISSGPSRIQVKKNWHGAAYNPIAEYERTPNIHTSEEFEPQVLLNMSMPRIKLDSRLNNNARTHWFNLTDQSIQSKRSQVK